MPNIPHDVKPGRPKLYSDQDDAMNTYSVRLPARLARLARRIGDKNMSYGIRVALELFEKVRMPPP